MEDNVRMTGKPTTGAVAESGGVVTRRRALGDIGTNVTAAGAPAVAKPAVAKPVCALTSPPTTSSAPRPPVP